MSCHQKTGGFNTYFWRSAMPDEVHHLFINGKHIGVLPYLNDAPTCGNEYLKQKALFLQLPSGKYEVEVKDAQGKIKYAELLKLKRTAGSLTIGNTTSWTNGRSERTFKDDCLIEEIHYK